MLSVEQTLEFQDWMARLRDRMAVNRIAQRIVRLQSGLFGNAKFFEGIGELRIDYGPGYRVYFVRKRNTLIVLLCGGDKSTQSRDIERAKAMAEDI
jgi:putative addiction module killer protein